MLNKIIIAGIIAIVIIAGFAIVYSGAMTGTPKSDLSPDISGSQQTSGRNLTINLNEGLNLSAAP